MSGTISCGKLITSEISSSTSTLQIGSFTWPAETPASGTVLKTDGTGSLTFESINVRYALGTSDTSYTVTTNDDIVAITGSLETTINLPDPSTKAIGDLIYIVKEVSGTSIITILPFGTELISGGSSATLSSSYGSVKIYTNGVNWFALY